MKLATLTASALILASTLPLLGTPRLGGLNGARLNADLAEGVDGDVLEPPMITPDGSWLIYRADELIDQRFELFASPTDLSSGPIRLNDNLSNGDWVRSAGITPDGSCVIFEVGMLGNANGHTLYSVPPDGSQAPQQISPVGTSQILDWEITPDSANVIVDTILNGSELYRVSVDGSIPPTLLSGVPSLNLFFTVKRFEISSDSSFVVYRGAELSDTVELYRAPVNGGPRIRVCQPLADPQSIFLFRISADDSRVLYTVDFTANNQFDLYSNLADGTGTPVLLNSMLPANGDIDDILVDPNNAHVLYTADANVDQQYDLYTVPIDGGTAVQLTNHQHGGSILLDYQVDPTGQRVLYVGDFRNDNISELHSQVIDGSQPSVRLDVVPGYRSALTNPLISSDGTWVAYRATIDQPLITWRVFTTPIDGSATPILIEMGDDLRAQNDWQILPDDSRIAFRVFNRGALFNGAMITVRPDGTDWTMVSDPVLGFRGVQDFAVAPDSGHIYYRSDQNFDSVYELFKAPVDGSTSSAIVNGPLAPSGTIAGDVPNFRISPDSQWTVYQADQDIDEVYELYSVPSDATAAPVKLHADLQGGQSAFFDFVPTGDSSRVVFRGTLDGSGQIKLYSAPIDGSGPVTELSPPLASAGDVDELHLAADGSTVVFLADESVPGEVEIFSVPADGSASATQLNTALPSGGDVVDFELTPDGSQLLYRADQDTDGVFELYVVPLDGSSPSVKLNGGLVAGGDVGDPYGSSLGGRTVFLADADTDGVQEIYSVPTDASGPPVKLNDVFPAFTDCFDFRISEQTGRVLYYADPLVDQQGDLFSVPIDGSQAPIHLNNPILPVGGDVVAFEVSPDGQHVVYTADDILDAKVELYSVPIAGGVTPTRLNTDLGTNQDVAGFFGNASFQISADSSFVVFRSDMAVDERFEIWYVPILGDLAPRRINPPLSGPRTVCNFSLNEDNRVLYEADVGIIDRVNLYTRRASGIGENIRVNSAFGIFADIRLDTFFTPNFIYTPDGSQVHYIADQREDNAFELFTSTIEFVTAGDGLDRPTGPPTNAGTRPAPTSLGLQAEPTTSVRTNPRTSPRASATEPRTPTSDAIRPRAHRRETRRAPGAADPAK